LVGIDIQSDAVRIIQLRKSRSGCFIEQAAISALPEGAVTEGKIRDWDSIGTVLNHLVENLGLAGLGAAICLPVNLVRMQHIYLPSGISDAEIEMEIRAQVERDFPGMNATLCMDFDVVKPKQGRDWKVFFVVSREEYVSHYVKCINSTELNIKIVDVDVLALQRILNFSVLDKPNKVKAMVFEVNDSLMLLLTDGYEILSHQQWSMRDTTDLKSQLIDRIQIMLASVANGEIQKIAIYSDKKYHQELLCHEKEHISSVYELDPWIKFRINPHLHIPIHSENSANFLIACGLAMREAPKW
jgi:Tfp pilus assembly PilM family ATPase